VRLRILLAGLTILLTGKTLLAQIPTDVMGMHNLGPGSSSPISGARPDSCAYCHAPHTGLNRGLWNQKLTTQIYTTYTSDTESNRGRQPVLGEDSNECLSCHDGTVAVGSTVAYGQVTMRGAMNSQDVFGNNLQSSHPFSMVRPLKDNIDLVATLARNGKTADTTGAVRLIKGDVECTSCHNPHVQAKDLVSRNFLVKDSSSAQLCLACHDPTRVKSNQVNPLADWATSQHAISAAQIAPSASLGSYPTVAKDACISCHTPHNASGAARLLRAQNELDCLTCHNGGSSIPSGMAPYANLANEYGSAKVGHPFPTSTNPHDAAENTLLSNNRHATCVDCHSAHGTEQVGTFPPPPLLRVSQKDVAGISSSDGITVLAPAINQYENCLRCHGTSSGKQVKPIYGYFPVRAVAGGDPLNLIPQFATSATSSHPVMHLRSSSYSQPSLRTAMLNLDGSTAGRTMGTQILCTDCHNSDDNREFGGTGPNGPHGSKWSHILERNYGYNAPPVQPGGTVGNLFLSNDLSVTGPYGLCAKCHDLTIVESSTSWAYHANHIADGFSCSTCHTAHGMVAGAGAISGERLVNFDMNIVGSNSGAAVSYSKSTGAAGTCVLVCHGTTHNSDGSVSMVIARKVPGLKK
jgi:predicted CXXCH cytochrome family protein